MAANDPIQLLQKGLRVTLGGVATLLETIQDPSKREANLGKLQMDLSELAQDLEVKGEVTEQEARNFVDSLLARSGQPTQGQEPGSSGPTEIPIDDEPGFTAPPPPTDPSVQADLQELIQQVASLRSELERLRSEESEESGGGV